MIFNIVYDRIRPYFLETTVYFSNHDRIFLETTVYCSNRDRIFLKRPYIFHIRPYILQVVSVYRPYANRINTYKYVYGEHGSEPLDGYSFLCSILGFG